ncbi:MAG TPA: radical SAM protein [Vicinamibacterales bacterium]|nr:radical SAM protein [Vicinamibacterales bacterium]
MQPSMFNVRVPLPERGEVFLMNTFTDAQLLVSPDVADLLDRLEQFPELPIDILPAEDQAALAELRAHGFVVDDREAERRQLEVYFRDIRESTEQVRVTVLTTLQCNFACPYCYQGDHGDYNARAPKMSLETAAQVAAWVEQRLDAVRPRTFALTFFGGEPLLNLPVVYYLAERLWTSCQARGVRMLINVITNGLLLTPEVVDRLKPFGLNGVKITLDGDRETHDRLRPLRGGQGTFERIIENIRRVADRCQISIGGNFDESSVDSYPALLDFLRQQDFADKLAKVNFKPIIRGTEAAPPAVPAPNGKGRKSGLIPLTAVDGSGKPLGGTCMTAAGAGVASSVCSNCHFVDEKMAFLREETKKRGFKTVDGVHMGPCEIHRRHAYTVGPDGSLYPCPGFTGDLGMSIGHIDGRFEEWRERAAARFEALSAWRVCDDCAFIPVCAGGCATAAHVELGNLDLPNCHKKSFEEGVAALAREAASEAQVAYAG